MPNQSHPGQTHSCPSWCDRSFCDNSELPSDQMHLSRLIEVAGVARRRWIVPDGTVVRAAETVVLNVLASRYLTEHRTWVVIATDEGSLEVSPETARELHRSFRQLLNEIDA